MISAFVRIRAGCSRQPLVYLPCDRSIGHLFASRLGVARISGIC